MNNYTVYMYVSPSDKRYIGITSRDVEKRWGDGKNYRNNIYFTNAIKHYGWDNFEHIIVARGLTKEEACWLEIELIKVWGSSNRDKGYNISLGGESGNHSEETRKKISESRKGENNPRAKAIICITLNAVFSTIKEGAKCYGTYINTISKCCKYKRKSAGKYNDTPLVWRYIEIIEL